MITAPRPPAIDVAPAAAEDARTRRLVDGSGFGAVLAALVGVPTPAVTPQEAVEAAGDTPPAGHPAAAVPGDPLGATDRNGPAVQRAPGGAQAPLPGPSGTTPDTDLAAFVDDLPDLDGPGEVDVADATLLAAPADPVGDTEPEAASSPGTGAGTAPDGSAPDALRSTARAPVASGAVVGGLEHPAPVPAARAGSTGPRVGDPREGGRSTGATPGTAGVIGTATSERAPAATPSTTAATVPGLPGPVAAAPTAPPTSPVGPPLADQLVTRVAPLRHGPDGRTELVLDLDPADLGPLRVEVALESGRLSLLLRSESGATADLLRQALGDLRRALDDAGVTTGDLLVTDHDADPSPHTGEDHRRGAAGDTAATAAEGRAPRADLQRGPSDGLDLLL